MLQNPCAARILEDLKWLEALNIDIHAQIVLCSNYNDGFELQRTFDDLKKFKKSLKSLAVVPVGVTKCRESLMTQVDKAIAQDTLKCIDAFNLALKKPVANAADEIFLLAGVDIPPKKYYGKFSQIEDGVGAMRLFSDSFENPKKRCCKLNSAKKLTIATGPLAAKMFAGLGLEHILPVEILEVKNEFFGPEVTVAGLIVGSDIIKTLAGRDISALAIPSVMLRAGTEEFLDGTTVSDIRAATAADIYIVKDCYNFKEILKILGAL
jgi:NifB/MoaA-like Fe-S oxidoreductase